MIDIISYRFRTPFSIDSCRNNSTCIPCTFSAGKQSANSDVL